MQNNEEKIWLETKTEAQVYLIHKCSSPPDQPDGTEYTVLGNSIEPTVTLFDDVKAWRVNDTVRKNGVVQPTRLGNYGYYLTQDGVLMKRLPEGPMEETENGPRFREDIAEKYKATYNQSKQQ